MQYFVHGDITGCKYRTVFTGSLCLYFILQSKQLLSLLVYPSGADGLVVDEPGEQEDCDLRVASVYVLTLSNLYYNVGSPASFGSVKALARGSKLPLHKVRTWLKSQFTYTLHRTARKRFRRRKYMVRKMDFQHQADLVEMISYARDNAGYRYLLAMIDIFSRYAWASP